MNVQMAYRFSMSLALVGPLLGCSILDVGDGQGAVEDGPDVGVADLAEVGDLEVPDLGALPDLEEPIDLEPEPDLASPPTWVASGCADWFILPDKIDFSGIKAPLLITLGVQDRGAADREVDTIWLDPGNTLDFDVSLPIELQTLPYKARKGDQFNLDVHWSGAHGEGATLVIDLAAPACSIRIPIVS